MRGDKHISLMDVHICCNIGDGEIPEYALGIAHGLHKFTEGIITLFLSSETV